MIVVNKPHENHHRRLHTRLHFRVRLQHTVCKLHFKLPKWIKSRLLQFWVVLGWKAHCLYSEECVVLKNSCGFEIGSNSIVYREGRGSFGGVCGVQLKCTHKIRPRSREGLLGRKNVAKEVRRSQSKRHVCWIRISSAVTLSRWHELTSLTYDFAILSNF